MKKVHLFASTNAYALGLSHYKVARDREHMNELVVKAEMKENQYVERK